MEQFHEKIRRLRLEKNISQRAMAKRMGIHNAFLSDVERNKVLPSTDMMKRFAEFFKLTVRQLLTDVVYYKWDVPWQIIPEKEYMDMILED